MAWVKELKYKIAKGCYDWDENFYGCFDPPLTRAGRGEAIRVLDQLGVLTIRSGRDSKYALMPLWLYTVLMLQRAARRRTWRVHSPSVATRKNAKAEQGRGCRAS